MRIVDTHRPMANTGLRGGKHHGMIYMPMYMHQNVTTPAPGLDKPFDRGDCNTHPCYHHSQDQLCCKNSVHLSQKACQ